MTPHANGYTYQVEDGEDYLAEDYLRGIMAHAVTCVTLNDDGVYDTELLALFRDKEHAKQFIEQVLL